MKGQDCEQNPWIDLWLYDIYLSYFAQKGSSTDYFFSIASYSFDLI